LRADHRFNSGRRNSTRMSQPAPNEISELLVAWGGGDESALDRLMPLVYGELRRLAHRYMSQERPGHTLQTTALVNEAYLRLVNWREARWQNRAHFFAVSAQMMRRILVDFARDKQSLKRGADALQVSLSQVSDFTVERDLDLVALDEALTALAEVDRRKSKVVEMRFFGGLSVKEVAEVLKVSEETVLRDWRLAKVWLLRELDKSVTSDE
jgi:RNA polymerase sigma-70 factor (ECF subfamily)